MVSVVKQMMEEDRQTQLGYILQSTIARTSMESGHRQERLSHMRQYELYKKDYASDIAFDPAEPFLSMLNLHIDVNDSKTKNTHIFIF